MEKIVERVPQERVVAYDMVSRFFGDKKVIMFDIETTGLSPMKSFTYIIGVNVFEDGEWKIIQLFNDDGRSEPEMIRAFQQMLLDADILFEFNGDTFDIPYIQKRMDFVESKFHIRLTDNFDKIQSFDMMKIIRPYKFALGLPNIKQKTLEKYIGIDRVDMYNGGQLIDVYLGYLAMGDARSRRLVLQHNRDDMEGMIYLSSLLAIEGMAMGHFKLEDISTEAVPNSDRLKFVMKLKLDMSLNRPIATMAYGIDIYGHDNELELKAPILQGALNYYYGSTEKSGKEEREGYFVPMLKGGIDKLPGYKEKARDKNSFVMLDDAFLGNRDMLELYAKQVISEVLRFKGK